MQNVIESVQPVHLIGPPEHLERATGELRPKSNLENNQMSRFEIVETHTNANNSLTYIVADYNVGALHYVIFRYDNVVQIKSWYMDDEDHTMPSHNRCDISEWTAWDVLDFLGRDDVPELLRAGWHEMGSELVHYGWWEFCPDKFAQRLAHQYSEA